jgi:outer membrane biosynthesis protein TonB
MALTRQFAVVLVAWGLFLGAACEKKKPQLPAKIQAPTIAATVPDQIPEIEVPPEPPAQQQPVTAEEPAPKKAPPKHKNAKKPTQPPPVNQDSSTVAVNHPPANAAVESPAASAPAAAAPAPDTAIAADVTRELIHQKQTTTELLDSTEKDLKGLNRSLNHDEETMLTQIKSYIQQSRKATADGDFERAFNLATKAHLLSDALTKK